MRPPPRRRSTRSLTLAEREEISRGLADGRSVRSIALSLSRAPSTVSRELRRNGGRDGYRAGQYDESTPESLYHFHSLVPYSRIVIFENSAHMTMLDEPEAYADTVRVFLSDVDEVR